MAVVLFTLPLLGDITLGTAIGVVAGVAEFLLARGPKNPAPKAMTSAWGDTLPIVYNTFRVPGKVIQAGELMEVDVKIGPGKKTNNYSLTFAVAICEGSIRKYDGTTAGVTLGRIWADNGVIYDPRPNANPPNWQANHLYGAGDFVFAPGVTDWLFTATVNGESGASQPPWHFESDSATRDNEEVWLATKYRPRNKIGKQYNFYFTFYPGTEDQLPDSSLEEQVGTGNQPAYRGMAYVVFYSFDLSRYGNRIPNFEFEIFPGSDNEFVTDAVDYGTALGSNYTTSPFMTDDCGNLYSTNGTAIANDKILSTVTPGDAAITTAAVGFGMTPPTVNSSWQLVPIAGKYFIAVSTTDSPLQYNVVIYEVNCDGSLTALGCKSYPFTFSGVSFMSTIQAATIRTDTQEIMVTYGGFATEQINIGLFDSVAALTGAWALQPGSGRFQFISDITGDFAAVPGPYLGYCLSFVGSDLYVTLNKAHMDWLAANPSGTAGWCSFYNTLRATYPDGVQLKITSTGGGVLLPVYEGVTTDFGWPFADEGKNSAFSAGTTLSPTRDCWSIPCQQQEGDGTVDAVWFVRGYSDRNNQVAVTEFADGAIVNQSVDVPFTAGSGFVIDEPRAAFAGDAIYMTTLGSLHSAGMNTMKLGAFVGTSLTLADICADVSFRNGLILPQMQYAGLEPVVPTGAALLQRDTGRSFIESMQPAFFFDLTDIGPKIVGSLRSNDTIIQVIPEADLSATPAASSTQQSTVVDKISSTRNDDLEIPEDLSINYYDSQHDYQQGSQQARRSKVTEYSSGKNTVSVPIVMSPYDANNAAQRGLYLLWVERITRKFILPPEYLARTPVDVVELSRDGRVYVVRITRATIKANWTIEIEAVSEDLGTYAITGPYPITSTASGSFTEGTINPPSTPVLAVVDTATLRPVDLTLPGTYVAAANSDGGVYDTVTAQESPDDSTWADEATLPNEAAIGTVAVALGAPRHYAVWDAVNSLTVSLYYGTLANADKWALTDDITVNLAWLSNGEIIQFATAALNPDGTYTLSGLRRGRLGTEQFCNTHGANETMVMLTQTVMGNVTYSASDIGATRYWQALNDAPINPASPVQTLVMATRRLLPYAPTFIRGSRDTPGNLTATGLRRARWHGQPFWSPAETDTPPTVEIDILNGSTVVRTLTSVLSANGSGITAVPSPGPFTAYYAVADQIIDFGSAQASVSLKAYSRNATIGRGYAGARAA